LGDQKTTHQGFLDKGCFLKVTCFRKRHHMSSFIFEVLCNKFFDNNSILNK